MLRSLLSIPLNSNQVYIEYLIYVGFYWVKWVIDDAGPDRNFIANFEIKHEIKFLL